MKNLPIAIEMTLAAVLLLAAVASMARQTTAEPLVFYASQSGRPTLDQGEGGGNPFASALIELLERPSLTSTELHSGLVALTKEKSRGFQVPDAPKANSIQWRLKPIPASAKRVALVFVYSNYRKAGAKPLPGAERDLQRVAAALKKAGFNVQTAIDPTRDDLHAALEALSRQSKEAEAAIIYSTGHGFEHRGQAYLMPNDYPFNEGAKRLPDLAIHVPSLASFLNAKSANIVFFGGCRTYMRDTPKGASSKR